MASKRLTRYLTTPSKIASALDWRKSTASVLSVKVSSGNRLDLTLASHPSLDEPSIPMQPLSLKYIPSHDGKHHVLDPSVVRHVKSICQSHNVCGLVVDWPLQKEGRMGAQCGKVLHALDALVAADGDVFTQNRQFCFWDGHHTPTSHEDPWGRHPRYGRPCSDKGKKEHIASREQYEQEQHCHQVASDVWDDYCKAHWPELCAAPTAITTVALVEDETREIPLCSTAPASSKQNDASSKQKDACSTHDSEWLDSFEERGCYLHAAVL